MTTGHFPSDADVTAQQVGPAGPKRVLTARAVPVVVAVLMVLAGCALSPAAAGPVPNGEATAGATAAATTSATVSANPSPSPTATAPPDPLANLSATKRKQFKKCMSKKVGPGSSGDCAKLAQKELKQAGFYPWSLSTYVSVAGVNAVLNYQRSRGLSADGFVGKATWTALALNSPSVSKELPKKCYKKGVVLCVDQAHRKLFWLKNGTIVKTFKVRLGGYAQHAKTGIWRNFPTANGSWQVYDKQVNPYSENYGSGAMPYSTIFYPDMYVHYSPGFNSQGYSASSHGCVNIRKLSDAQWIFKRTPLGAKVHIYSRKATT